jgi:hypothetical protein
MRSASAILIVLLLAGCYSGPLSARCQEASPALVAWVQSGLGTDADFEPGSQGRTDLSLANAYVVKSREVEMAHFDNLYFVAARIEGSDTEDGVGVWAIDDPAGEGQVFSADATAEELSGYGTGPGFSSADDGYAEARACAED